MVRGGEGTTRQQLFANRTSGRLRLHVPTDHGAHSNDRMISDAHAVGHAHGRPQLRVGTQSTYGRRQNNRTITLASKRVMPCVEELKSHPTVLADG